MRRHAGIVYRDPELCFPEVNEQECRKMVVKNFKFVGMGLVEIGMAWFWPGRRIARWTEMIGMEHICDMRARKHGVLLVGIHFLAPKLGTRRFGIQEPSISVYHPNDNPLTDQLQTWGRLRSNKSILDRKDLKDMVKALRKDEVVWYVPDHDYGPHSNVFVPLFAVEQTATTTGTQVLARMSGACLMPFIPRRKPDGKGYQLIILPPECSPPPDDVETTAAWMNRVVEKRVMVTPEQYMWLHRHFKTHPEGVLSRYQISHIGCFKMASGITTADPSDLATKALWIAPPGSRAHNQCTCLFFLCSLRLTHQQRIAMSPCESDTPINWRRNLIVAWLGCFLTGTAFSLVVPFLPPYAE